MNDTPELTRVESPAPPETPVMFAAATYSPNERAIARAISQSIADEFRLQPMFSELVRAIAYLADELAAENFLAGHQICAEAWSVRAKIIARCAGQLDNLHTQI